MCEIHGRYQREKERMSVVGTRDNKRLKNGKEIIKNTWNQTLWDNKKGYSKINFSGT